jgi:hypothetical protein
MSMLRRKKGRGRKKKRGEEGKKEGRHKVRKEG